MSLLPHLPTLHLAAAISAAIAAALLLCRKATAEEMGGRTWIVCFMAMSIGFGLMSVRDALPGWVPIIVSNGLIWLSVASAWHGNRQLRGARSHAALVPLPSLLWAGLCLIPSFYGSERVRIAVAGLFALVLISGASAESWRSWRATGLASLRDVALLFCVFVPYALLRATAWMLGLEWLSNLMSGWLGLVAATAMPYLILAVTRERAALAQRQREMAALSEGRAEVDRLLRDLPAVVFLREVQPDGSSRLLYRGGDVERALGWPAAEVAKMDDVSHLAVNLTDEDRATAYARAAQGDVVSLEYQTRKPDGATKWVRASGRVLERRPDGTSLAVGYITDIQDLRDAQARASNAARLASLGEMAAGLAHELRQPLAIISMAAENALDDIETGDQEAAEARLSRIVRQTQRASDIIDNLRRFALGAQESGTRTPVALQDALDRSLMLVGGILHRAGVRVARKVDDPSPVALAWPGAIEQILVNLLSNANDALASRPHGKRHVRIEATADPAAGTVRLLVADSGGGVAPEILPRLFQPFVTSKTPDRGTGLGLAICHGMAKALGGSITVENQGEGAVFTLVLPTHPALSPEAAG